MIFVVDGMCAVKVVCANVSSLCFAFCVFFLYAHAVARLVTTSRDIMIFVAPCELHVHISMITLWHI